MSSVTPLAFTSINAIEAMMTDLGSVRCKSLDIGRQDNFNHIIHRPRDAHKDPKTKAVIGRIYQHRTYCVNQPNGRIIWIFERFRDNMLFLIAPRKGPLAYKVFLNNQTFSSTLWLYGQNFLKEEKAAEAKSPSALQAWLRANRPQDAGTTGEYLKYKAHIAKLAASTNNSTGQTDVTAGNETDVAAVSSITLTIPTSTGNIGPEKDPESTETSLPAVASITIPTKAAKKSAPKKSASKKLSAGKTKEVSAPTRSSRRLRGTATAEISDVETTKSKKRTATDAGFDDEETENNQEEAPHGPAPELARPPRIPPKFKPKKRRVVVEPPISEKANKDHCQGLLFNWSYPSQQDDSNKMELDGVDFTPRVRVNGSYLDFTAVKQRTMIRYSTVAQDTFGGPFHTKGKAIVMEMSNK